MIKIKTILFDYFPQMNFEKRTRPQSERALGGEAALAERAWGCGSVGLE